MTDTLPRTEGPLRWLKRNLLWHLSWDGVTPVCGSVIEGQPQTRALGDGPPQNICKNCQREQMTRLGL